MDTVVGECLAAFVFGSVVGLLVQRSRFCNTAALRDASPDGRMWRLIDGQWTRDDVGQRGA